MQIILNNKLIFYKFRISNHFFIFLSLCGILNIYSSTLIAEELRVHPMSIVFNAVEGRSSSYTRSLFLTSTNGGSLNWNLSKDASWIAPDLSGGYTDGVIKIGVNSSGLIQGIYYGNITLNSSGSTTGPIIIPVSLIVNPDVPVIVTTWKDGKDGAMSVSVDDSQPSGFDALQANGFKGTYVLEGLSSQSFFTDYYNAGMELGSHTASHRCQSWTDDLLRNQEIEPNILAVCTQTPQPCKDVISFVWPCGYTNYREQTVAADYFLSARGYNINKLEDATPENFMNLKSYNSHEHTPYPPSDLKTVVDDAINQNKWFNLVLHNYSNDDGATSYASAKNIWVSSIGTVIKYILQRNNFILTNYTVSSGRITFNVSRLTIPSSVWRSFESAFGSDDLTTIQIDIDDTKNVENVFVNGVINQFQTKVINGNTVLLTNVKLEPGISKTVEAKYVGTVLTISGITANNKVYNGTAEATLNSGNATLVGVIPGDVVTLVTSGATGTFVNPNVGSAKVVTTSGFTLAGTDAGKYFLTAPTASADITPLALTVSGIKANNKVYNGTTLATLNTEIAAPAGVLPGDIVNLIFAGAVGTFVNADVGTAKPVTISGITLGGSGATNYSIIQPSSSADIAAIALTISGVTANNKVYDGTTAAVLNTVGAFLIGVLQGDDVTLVTSGATGTFVNKSTGIAKSVTISGITLAGTRASNYTFVQPATTADITGLILTVSGVTANNKVYNGTTSATLNTGSATMSGELPGDIVTLVFTGAAGTFVDKNAGTAKSVTISGISLGGIDAGNYSLTQPSSAADITPSGLFVSGVTVNNKVYDGTTTAVLNTGGAILTGVFGTDAVTLVKTGATGTFTSPNAGTDIFVTTSGFALAGTDANNYTLTQPVTTGNITGFVLTITGVTASNKVYDGTRAATLNTGSAALSGVLGGNTVSLVTTGATGTFANKNVGTTKSVSTSGFTLEGDDAGNYSLTQPFTTATITTGELTIGGSFTANNKVYDGTNTATIITNDLTLLTKAAGDDITLAAVAVFAGTDVGPGILVSLTGSTLAGADASNYTLSFAGSPTTTATITVSGLTVTGVTANNRVYDGTTSATLNAGGGHLAGVVSGDIVNLEATEATGNFDNKNIGSGKLVRISGFNIDGRDAWKYTLIQPTSTASITSIGLTVTGVSAISKVYDGTTTANLNTESAILVGVLETDFVNLVLTGARGAFANKNVGTSKSVSTSGFTLSGADAVNYTLIQPTTSGNITPVTITISGVKANNKVYNGTTATTLNTSGVSLVGVLGTDVVNPVFTGAAGTFMNDNVGTAIPVTISGITLGGTGAANYTLIQPSSFANITPFALTVSGITANNKVYDGTTVVTLNTGGALLVGLVSGDVVVMDLTGAAGIFVNKNAGTARSVIISGITIGGAGVSNYTITQPATSANITPITLTVSGITANNKVYNGTTSATLNTGSATLAGVLPGDVVSIVFTGATATFVNKYAGTARSVSISGITLGSTDAGNYNVTQPSSSADITPAGLTVSGVTANNKVYDGTYTAILNTGSASLVGIFGTDVVTLLATGATGTFASANVGTAIVVRTSGFTLGGTDSNNYTLTQPATTGNIMAIVLTVAGLKANSKVYDGTTSATLNSGSATLSGVLPGSNVYLVSSVATGTFANKNVGTTKSVSTSGFSLGGTDASKYMLTQPTTSANITPFALSISGLTAYNKVYNGTTTATLNTGSAVLSGVWSGDVVNPVYTAANGTFVNKNVGIAKPVTISGITLGGAGSSNYTLIQPSSFANITPFALSVSGITANNKVYDGTAAVTLNTGGALLVGVVPGDVVTIAATGATGVFVDKNAGSAKSVIISGITIGGAGVSNYSITQPTASADIRPLSLMVSGVTANNRVYNGTTSATLNTGSAVLPGVLPGDIVSMVFTGATGTFENKNIGTAKSVAISGISLTGTDAGSYTLTQPAITADITPASLTVSGVTANNKVYDGTTNLTLNTGGALLVGIAPGDVVTLDPAGGSGTFVDKYAGLAKSTTISGFKIGGAGALNYTLAQPSLSADIIPLSITVSGVTANNKVYDGTISATLNTESATLTGVLTGNIVFLVTTGAKGTFANKNVGITKSVSTSGFTLEGADAVNYSLIQSFITADITTRELTIEGTFTANNKEYDGTDEAIILTNNLTLHTKTASDYVTLTAVAVFASSDVGKRIIVRLTGSSLAGTDAPNYTLSLTGSPTTLATIALFGLTVTGVTANNKEYDGTTITTLNTERAELIGIRGTDIVDIVSLEGTGNFVNKNVGSGILVRISGLDISGPDAWKYTLIQPTSTASITTTGLAVTGIFANNKIYDGTTSATLNTYNATLTGIIGTDHVNLNSAGANGIFVNKYAGIANTVLTTGFSIGGADAVNYTLTQPSLFADIIPLSLTVSGVKANNKVYNGTTATTLNTEDALIKGVRVSDEVTLISDGVSGNFSDKNVGTAKSVFSSGFMIVGADAGNYVLTQPSLIADITPKMLIINSKNLLKSYGATLTFTGTEVTADGLVTGDAVPIVTIYSPGAQSSASIGEYVIFLSGGSDDNYSYTFVNGILTVTKSVLIAKAEDKTRTYGSGNPVLTITYSGFQRGEDVSVVDVKPIISTTALITSDVGSYTISLSGGSDNNYDITLVNGNLEIAKAPLTITAQNKNKVYGQINPALLITYSGFVLGHDSGVLDILPVAETIANINSDAGEYNITISGAADASYSFIYKNGTLTINKADQEITFSEIPTGLRMTQEQQMDATASSGLSVSFKTSDPSIVSINGDIMTVNREGKLTITAFQEGDHNWNTAKEVNQSILTLPTFDNISSLFTPNSDGMNDYWYITDLEQYGKLQVTVYNRFGLAVYRSDSYKNDWDGTWNGYPLPSASYYYVIKSSQKGYIKGVVNILR
jgi:gliding motility-associated-like protein